MRFKFFIISILINFLTHSQESHNSDTLQVNSNNSISGVYNYNNNIPIFNFNYSGDNSISNNKLSLNTNTVYMLQKSIEVIANEWQQKTNINYKNFFIMHVFNSSMIRKIDFDNSVGIGVGKWWKGGSISYAALAQNTNYSTSPTVFTVRHSVRVKLKYATRLYGINFEYYYQPSFTSLRDVIVYGNFKITLFNFKSINFVISDIVNYRSRSAVKLIHTLTLGINFNLKKYEN